MTPFQTRVIFPHPSGSDLPKSKPHGLKQSALRTPHQYETRVSKLYEYKVGFVLWLFYFCEAVIF